MQRSYLDIVPKDIKKLLHPLVEFSQNNLDLLEFLINKYIIYEAYYDDINELDIIKEYRQNEAENIVTQLNEIFEDYDMKTRLTEEKIDIVYEIKLNLERDVVSDDAIYSILEEIMDLIYIDEERAEQLIDPVYLNQTLKKYKSPIQLVKFAQNYLVGGLKGTNYHKINDDVMILVIKDNNYYKIPFSGLLKHVPGSIIILKKLAMKKMKIKKMIF